MECCARVSLCPSGNQPGPISWLSRHGPCQTIPARQKRGGNLSNLPDEVAQVGETDELSDFRTNTIMYVKTVGCVGTSTCTLEAQHPQQKIQLTYTAACRSV